MNKELEVELVMKPDFYRTLESPVLPIPFSKTELQKLLESGGIPITVIADNLLMMIQQNPERTGLYRQLIINSCIEAGKEIYKSGNFALMNSYYVEAEKLNPQNCETRKLLARSYQLLNNLDEAIENYQFFIKNSPEPDYQVWVYFIECLYLSGEVEHAKGLVSTILRNIENKQPGEKLFLGFEATSLLSADKAPSELRDLFKPFFNK
jgi:tetratricopeptide (TPR) repeat protein